MEDENEMESILKDIFTQRRVSFSTDHGFGALLEMYCLVIFDLLVDKGITTESVIMNNVMKKMNAFENTKVLANDIEYAN